MALVDSCLFRSLSEVAINDLLDSVQVKETVFERGDILAMQGEQCNRLIILVEGSVTAEMTDPSGKITKVEDIDAPNPLAILFLFGSRNKFPVEVIALDRVVALVIPKASVLKMLSLSEIFLQNYLDVSANYATKMSQKLHFMSFKTIRQKLAMYFLNLETTEANTVKLDKTQESLAEYFGVSRPALSRELKNMQTDGLIRINKRQIEFIDKQKIINIVKF